MGNSQVKAKTREWKGCHICGKGPTERHHVFPGPNRKNSEKWGMVVDLCTDHHRDGPKAAHRCRKTADKLKREAQAKFELTHTRDEFMKIFGRNYL